MCEAAGVPGGLEVVAPGALSSLTFSGLALRPFRLRVLRSVAPWVVLERVSVGVRRMVEGDPRVGMQSGRSWEGGRATHA